MNNKNLIERAGMFVEIVRHKNSTLANAISQAFIPLLEYNSSLENISREELLKIKGIKKSTANYFVRLFKGEDIQKIADNVLEVRIERKYGHSSQRSDRGDFNGCWDNAVRTYEG